MNTIQQQAQAKQLQETLDRLNEDLLSLSDDIWLSIDHNDTDAMKEGVKIKTQYNDKLTQFAQLSKEMTSFLLDVSNLGVNEEPKEPSPIPCVADHQRIIESLNQYTPHTLKEEFRYKRPIAIQISDKVYQELTTWKAVFHAVMEHFYHTQKEHYLSIPDSKLKLSKRGKPLFSRSPSGMRVSEEAAGGIYIEVNQSADRIKDRMVEVCEYLGQPIAGVNVYFREDRNAWGNPWRETKRRQHGGIDDIIDGIRLADVRAVAAKLAVNTLSRKQGIS